MKRIVIYFLPAVITLFFIYGFGGDAKWPGGSPGGYTGSPGDGKNCTQCHGGNASTELGWITSDIPPEGYIPGETYMITVTVSGSGDKGFEVSPQDKSGNLLGTLIAGTGTHLVSGNKAVTQNSASSANPKVWQFEWTAPEAGTGDVTFYGAFTVNKPVTKLSTYIAHENEAVQIDESPHHELSVFPNPATDKIHISIMSAGDGNCWIDLISMSGQVIKLLENASIGAGLNEYGILLPSSIKEGIYVLNYRDKTGSSTQKLIIR